jgi:hypothetical protein
MNSLNRFFLGMFALCVIVAVGCGEGLNSRYGKRRGDGAEWNRRGENSGHAKPSGGDTMRSRALV